MVTIKAEFISVGNPHRYQAFFEASIEYLRGELCSIGIPYEGHTLVNNTAEQLFTRIKEAIHQSGLVVVFVSPETTSAQIVNTAICMGISTSSDTDPRAVSIVQNYVARHKRQMNQDEINIFAQLPQGAVLLPNQTGLVQGYALPSKKQLILVLPSAPSELSTLFTSQVRKLLQAYCIQMPPIHQQHRSSSLQTSRRILRAAQLSRTILLPSVLQPLMEIQNPRIELQENMGDYQIIIEATANTKASADHLCDQTVAKLKILLGSLLYSTDGTPLKELVVSKLVHLNKSLAVAESASSGLLAQCLQGVKDASPILVFQANTPDRMSKQNLLGVSKKLLTNYGGSSRQAAAAMALGARHKGGADLGLAVTGVFSSRIKGRFPLGTIHVALTNGQQVWIRSLRLNPTASVEYYTNIAILQALNILHLYCQNFPDPLPGGISPTQALKNVGIKRPSLFDISHKFGGTKWNLRTFTAQTNPDKTGNTDLSFIQRLKTGKIDTNDKIRLGVVGLCTLVFISCIAYIGSVYLESYNNAKLNDSLSALLVEEVVPEEIVDNYPSSYQTKFAALYAQNPDVAGWIKIEGTKVNYVVVQANDNTTYDRTDFSRNHNNHGVPFVDFRVSQQEPSTNTVIYAHNMNDGQMFGELMGYKSLAYYQKHPTISYDSIYYDGQYKIFGIVICKQDDPEFNYHNFIEAPNDSAMLEYISKIRERSLINTKVDVGIQDKLLTLSTCDYSFKSAKGERIARFVVFARKVREGESLQVNTAEATLNLNPVMPQEWYDKLARDQEAERKAQEAAQATQIANQWLTSEELSTLSAKEQAQLANLRQADSASYLTYDERESSDLSISSKLELIHNRKSLFRRFLDSDETELSIFERINLAEKRQKDALKYLTTSEIEYLYSYEDILDAIEVKKIALNAEAKWLTQDEAATLLDNERKALVAQRQALAQKAGLSDYELYSTNSWPEIQKLITQKQEKNTLVEGNQAYLNNNDLNLSLTDLQILISSRQAQVRESELTDEELQSVTSWTQTQQLIAQKKAKNAFIIANASYLNKSELSRSLADLQILVSNRKSQAQELFITDDEIASCQNWDTLHKLIEQKKAQLNENIFEQNLKNQFLMDEAKTKFLSINTTTATFAQLEKNYEENCAYAQKYLTTTEINSCKNWNEILLWIEQKTNSSNSSDTTFEPSIGFSP